MGSPAENSNTCAVCLEAADKSCGKCRQVHYCSVDHQRRDWKEHKKVCCPFVVRQSEEFGRYLVASRNLDARLLLIQEAPFAFAPYDTIGDGVPKCLCCCLRMSDRPQSRCSKCHWPICSPQCEQMSTHTNFECPIFAGRKVAYPPPQKDTTYSSLLIFRLLLQKDKCPDLWKDFLCMEHHSKIRFQKERCNADDAMILENIREYLGNSAAINEGEVREIIGRVSVNAFGITRREEGKNDDTVGRGIFLTTGIVAHGCVPNAVWGVGNSPNFDIIVRTAVGIKKGDMITPTYSDMWNSMGTYQRLVAMLERSHFLCKCKRCLDPTEMGTFLSAIKCPKCKVSYLLPLNPTDLSDAAQWQCQNCGAGDVQGTVVAIVDDIEYEIDEIIAPSAEHPKSTAKELEQLFVKYSGTILHPNHFAVRKIEKSIVERLFPLLSTCSFEELNKFIFHCENLLRVNDILTPGYSGHGGSLRYCLTHALVHKKAKADKEGCTSRIFKSTQDVNDHMRRIETLKEQTALHLENDPESSSTDRKKSYARTK